MNSKCRKARHGCHTSHAAASSRSSSPTSTNHQVIFDDLKFYNSSLCSFPGCAVAHGGHVTSRLTTQTGVDTV